jgi:hypothetical protein
MRVNGETRIRLNLSQTFCNKVNLSGNKAAMGYSFYPAEIKLTQLVTHIVNGGAFTMGEFKSNHRIESEFVSSQLLALDLDDCPMTIDELEDRYPIIQQSAFLMYPSPSSTVEQPKSRVLFVLDEPVEKGSRWRALQTALIEQFEELKPDTVCKDPARFFYGCQTRNYYVDYIPRFSIEYAANLIIPQAEREEFARIESQYATRRTRDNVNELSGLTNKWFDTAIQKVSSTPPKERHKAFLNYAMWLYGLNAGGWPIATDEIERTFTAISVGWGDPETEAEKSLRWAREHASPISTDEYKVSVRGRRAGMMQRLSRWGQNESR